MAFLETAWTARLPCLGALTSQEGVAYKPLGSPAQSAGHLRATLRRWSGACLSCWTATTSEPYLTCIVSRRSGRNLSVPAFAVWNFIFDVWLEAPGLWLQPVVVLFLGILAWLPQANLWCDLIALPAALTHSVVWLFMAGTEGDHFMHVFVMMSVYWTLALTFFAGVHAVFIMLYIAVFTSCMLGTFGIPGGMLALVFGTVVAAVVLVNDNRCAALLSECDRQEAFAQHLLQNLGDGCLLFSPQTGSLRLDQTVGKAVQELFEADGVQDVNVFELVRSRSDADYLKELRPSSDLVKNCRLISFTSASSEFFFDAMVMQIPSLRPEVSLAIRIIGDRQSARLGSKSQPLWPANPGASNAWSCEPQTSRRPEQSQANHSKRGKAGADVSFAMSWDEEAQIALLGPPTKASPEKVFTGFTATVGVQTSSEDTQHPQNQSSTWQREQSPSLAQSPPPQLFSQAQPAPPPEPPAPQGPPLPPVPPPPVPEEQPQRRRNAPPEPPGPPGLQGGDEDPQRLQLMRPSGGSRSGSVRRAASQGSRRSRRSDFGSMNSAGGRTRSESSIGSSAGALGLPTVESGFVDTDLLTRRKSIIIAMHHWNLPRNPDACCPWHSAVCAVDEVAQLEAGTRCKPLWSPFSGWQCSTCTSVNHPTTVSPCIVCGADQPRSEFDRLHGQQVQPGPPPSEPPLT